MELTDIVPTGEVPTLDKIEAFNELLQQFPQEYIPVQHLVHGGMYARTVRVKAGTYAVGAMLNHDNISVMVGDCTCSTNDGMVRLTGFNVLPANAGGKRVGYFHADTDWTMIMRIPDGMHDVDEIEQYITCEYDKLQSQTLLSTEPPQDKLEDKE